MRKVQQGFTLIELVVVITILGILAAFAIPRFASLDQAARISAIQGLAGSVRSAAALAHAQALVATTPQTGATGTVTLEGVSVGLVYGYPAFSTTSTTTGIATALNDFSGFTFAGTTPTNTWQMNGSTTCQVSYTQSTGSGLAPVIVAATGGC